MSKHPIEVAFCERCNHMEWEVAIQGVKLCCLCYGKTASEMLRGEDWRKKVYYAIDPHLDGIPKRSSCVGRIHKRSKKYNIENLKLMRSKDE